MYKRGNKKGKCCENDHVNNSLFCKDHKNSIFIEKRNIQYKNLSTFNPNDFLIKNDKNVNLIKTNSNLIICPSQLCDQWVKEYYDKFTNNKRVILIVTKDQYDNLTLGDILFSNLVVISYNFLLNEVYKNNILSEENGSKEAFINNNFNINLSNKNLSEHYTIIKDLLNSKSLKNLHLFHWNRIFLDEAHEIQNMGKQNELKNIIKKLSSDYKWNLSGTPFANGMDSYLNLMSYNTSYNEEISCSYNLLNTYSLLNMGLNSDLIKSSKYIFKRNTKSSIVEEYSGNVINEIVKKLNFTDQERNMYDSYLQNNYQKYTDILIKLCCHCELFEATKTLIKNCKTLDEIQEVLLNYNKNKLSELKNQINVLEKNIKNMQNLAELNENNDIQNFENNSVEYYKSMIGSYKKSLSAKNKEHDNIQRIYNYLHQTLNNIDNSEMCPICLDTIEKDKLTITKCGHKFCWECIYDTHNIKKETSKLFKCPTCNQEMKFNEIFILKDNKNDSRDSNELIHIINNVKSTKIGNIIYFIKNMTNKNDKIILFSQWDELLHKVGDLLANWNINIVYCNGSVYQRKKAIEMFKNNNINVIMLSSRNAASGINLTCANKIILLEPIYGSNEYRQNIESQAIGRADRIGQKRPIEVYKFIIKDTIEEDILNNNIDEKKIKQMSI
jgi:SNF2 family DNA or RNA helicase